MIEKHQAKGKALALEKLVSEMQPLGEWTALSSRWHKQQGPEALPPVSPGA